MQISKLMLILVHQTYRLARREDPAASIARCRGKKQEAGQKNADEENYGHLSRWSIIIGGRSMIPGFRSVYVGATSTGVVRNNCLVSFLHGRCFKKEYVSFLRKKSFSRKKTYCP